MKFQFIATGMVSLMLPLLMNPIIGEEAKPLMLTSTTREDLHSHPIAWGPMVDGRQAGLRLVTPHKTFAPGEPVWQEVYLRNQSRSKVVIQAIGGYEDQGAPIITDTKGARVKVLQYFGMGAMFTKNIDVQPGEIALVGRFALAFRSSDHDLDPPKEVAPNLSSSAEEMPLALAGTGSYVLKQDLIPMTADGKPYERTLSTGTVPIQIAGEPRAITPRLARNHFEELSHAPIAWGPPQSGLTVGLMYVEPKSRYFIGERIRLAVILRNVSKQPILFWHQTSFAFLNPPNITDAAGKTSAVALSPETEWKTLGAIQMTGVTFDMTFAPSADGPSRLRRSEIKPGQSVIGYYLTAFVTPPTWNDGRAAPGRYRVIQPVRIGLKEAELLDTTLETGSLMLEIADPGVTRR